VRRPPLIALLAIPLLAAGALAQDGEIQRVSDFLKEPGSIQPPERVGPAANPAQEYFRIWDTLPMGEHRAFIDAHGAESLKPGEKLDKDSRRLCEEHRAYVEALIRNANSGECDWGVRYDAGWMALLPHLSPLRQSWRVIRMDAYRCIDDQSYTAAAERLAALIRMSVQLRTDQILISTLVGASMCTGAVQQTESMIKERQLGPAQARLILTAIRSLPKDDPFGRAGCIERERYMSCEWMREHYRGPHAGFLFVREFEDLFSYRLDPFSRFICGMNESQLSADLDRFGRYFDAAAAAWRRPDNVAAMQELANEVWEGQYGLVARVMIPRTERAGRVINKANADLERVSAELAAIIAADETPAPAVSSK
jgi:hypothetical protein